MAIVMVRRELVGFGWLEVDETYTCMQEDFQPLYKRRVLNSAHMKGGAGRLA